MKHLKLETNIIISQTTSSNHKISKYIKILNNRTGLTPQVMCYFFYDRRMYVRCTKLWQKNNTQWCGEKKQSLHQETSAATSFRLWPSTLVARSTSSSATGSGFHTSSLNGGNLGVSSCTGFGTGRPRRGRRGAVGGQRWMARCASRPCQNGYPKTVPKYRSTRTHVWFVKV